MVSYRSQTLGELYSLTLCLALLYTTMVINMKKLIFIAILLPLLSACASHPDEVEETYVDHTQFLSNDCTDLNLMLIDAKQKTVEARDALESLRVGQQFAVPLTLGVANAITYGVGEPLEKKVADAKGKESAIRKAFREKNC